MCLFHLYCYLLEMDANDSTLNSTFSRIRTPGNSWHSGEMTGLMRKSAGSSPDRDTFYLFFFSYYLSSLTINSESNSSYSAGP